HLFSARHHILIVESNCGIYICRYEFQLISYFYSNSWFVDMDMPVLRIHCDYFQSRAVFYYRQTVVCSNCFQSSVDYEFLWSGRARDGCQYCGCNIEVQSCSPVTLVHKHVPSSLNFCNSWEFSSYIVGHCSSAAYDVNL